MTVVVLEELTWLYRDGEDCEDARRRFRGLLGSARHVFILTCLYADVVSALVRDVAAPAQVTTWGIRSRIESMTPGAVLVDSHQSWPQVAAAAVRSACGRFAETAHGASALSALSRLEERLRNDLIGAFDDPEWYPQTAERVVAGTGEPIQMRTVVPDVAQLSEYSAKYGVPMLDLQLMALNLYGVAGPIGDGRARIEVTLDLAPSTEWHLIVSTTRHESPFEIVDTALWLSGARIGSLRLIEHDDAQLGYVRDAGRVLTLNTNQRSFCTGCLFCPNTLADGNDPRLVGKPPELRQWLAAFLRQRQWEDLAHVRQINLSTGCFGQERLAIEHLVALRMTLEDFGFAGRLGILSSVIPPKRRCASSNRWRHSPCS